MKILFKYPKDLINKFNYDKNMLSQVSEYIAWTDDSRSNILEMSIHITEDIKILTILLENINLIKKNNDIIIVMEQRNEIQDLINKLQELLS